MTTPTPTPRAPGPSGRGRRRARALLGTLLAFALAAHLLVLYLPGDDVPQAGVEIPGLDKAIHVIAFAVPTLLAVLLAGRLWPALVFAVHAPVSEVFQAAQARGRTGDPWDVVADLAGVGLAAAAALALRRRSPGPGRGLDRRRPGAYASRVPTH
ncbi:VanZ family protein [Micrococcus sp.]|uniref:VanZ family protein n=1 Tax=Micrococcus sp. TaxID=1271 RepID=UPI002A9123F8|nr:VanZ family protein [Micrococcus sp.]MDY6054752.1 VanZ family protein [Micrococcus sp.]